MKRTIALLLALVLSAAPLGGCSITIGSGKPAGAKPPAAQGTTAAPKEKETPAELKGEIFSTGVYSVFVPAGWINVIPTLNGEENPDRLNLWEYGQMDNDIQISLFKGRYWSYYPVGKENYEDTQDLTPLVLESGTWEGFIGEYSGRSVAILTDAGEEGFQVSVVLRSLGGTTISLDDAAVLAIIGSISLDDPEYWANWVPPPDVDTEYYSLVLADGWELSGESDIASGKVDLKNSAIKTSDGRMEIIIIYHGIGSAEEWVAMSLKNDSYKEQFDNFVCNGAEYLRMTDRGHRFTYLFWPVGSDKKGFTEIRVYSIDDFDLFIPQLELITLK